MDIPVSLPTLQYKDGSVLPQVLSAYKSCVLNGIRGPWSTRQFIFDWMINKKAILPDGKIFSLRREEKKDTEQALRLILSDCVDRICIKVDNILEPARLTGGTILAGAAFIEWERFMNNPSWPLLVNILMLVGVSFLCFEGYPVWTEARKRHMSLMSSIQPSQSFATSAYAKGDIWSPALSPGSSLSESIQMIRDYSQTHTDLTLAFDGHFRRFRIAYLGPIQRNTREISESEITEENWKQLRFFGGKIYIINPKDRK